MKEAVDNKKNETYHKGALECGHCACEHFRVIYTRPAYGGPTMRRKECWNCGNAITIRERQMGR